MEAERLRVGHGDVGPHRARRGEHGERERIDEGDEQRAVPPRRGRQRRQVLEAAEVVRVLDDEAGGVVGEQALGLVGARRAAVVARLGQLDARAREGGAEDRAAGGLEAAGHDDLGAPRRARRQAHGLGERRRGVGEGRDRCLELRQLGDLRLESGDEPEQRLRRAGADGLRPHGRGDGVHHGGHIVVVDASAQEARRLVEVSVGRSQLGEALGELGLGQRLGDPQGPAPSQLGRDLREELVGGADAERGEQTWDVAGGHRDAGALHRRLPGRSTRGRLRCG